MVLACFSIRVFVWVVVVNASVGRPSPAPSPDWCRLFCAPYPSTRVSTSVAMYRTLSLDNPIGAAEAARLDTDASTE